MRITILAGCFLVLLTNQNLLATNQAFNNYIQQYKLIAMEEMRRTGVPASIKIAQGLLESNAGRSTLAQKANNHFGIKCGNSWKGKTYYRKDDDYKRGRLIKSCFRKYKHSTKSYIAHSNFLKDNRRYKNLFSLNPKDYKAWAKGLKKAGYATSSTYDKKLVKLIEEYHLYKLDYPTPSGSMPVDISSVRIAKKEYTFVNDIKMIYAKEGDTPHSIAKRLNISAKQIVRYNEGIRSTSQQLSNQTRVFLEKKKKKFGGRSKYHTVKVGQSMYSISQLYGIRLDKLYKINRMSTGDEPAVGEGIRLKGKARKAPKLRKNKYDGITSSNSSNTPTKTKIPSNTTSTSAQKTRQENTSTTYTTPNTTHTVQKGETLWRISQRYGLSVKELMDKNNLQSTTIHSGTVLKIK